MATHGKKYIAASEKVNTDTVFPFKDGLAKVKELAHAKFDESVDVHVNLGIDPERGEQAVRGSVVLPHSVGKKVRIVVFAKGDQADLAREAGADFVGTDDLVEKIEGGWLDFEYAVATPDLMGMVGKLAKVLGPRGLLPNKKVGTVALQVAPVINDLKKGRLFFKNDKSGLVHFSIGRVSFDAAKLQENLVAFIRALSSSKPASSKGKFIQKVTVTSTMGLGIRVNPDDIVNA
ncbi:MAG TPA: 50S ribosomal protein L1 [Candidatus Babeliales bacterium]|nr:50S ribosomal protein L1 [Candidatus Babeliales bacterium]